MEIKPIFTDDNAQSLSHYGVKGMKWHKHKASSEYDGPVGKATALNSVTSKISSTSNAANRLSGIALASKVGSGVKKVGTRGNLGGAANRISSQATLHKRITTITKAMKLRSAAKATNAGKSIVTNMFNSKKKSVKSAGAKVNNYMSNNAVSRAHGKIKTATGLKSRGR